MSVSLTVGKRSPAIDWPSGQALTETACDATATTYANSGIEVLVLRNSDSGDHTATFTLADGTTKTITLTAGKSYVIGPLNPAIYGSTVSFAVDTTVKAVVWDQHYKSTVHTR